MHTPWRNVSKHVMILEPVQRAIENLGWRYVSRKGRLGSTFERIGQTTEGRQPSASTITTGTRIDTKPAFVVAA